MVAVTADYRVLLRHAVPGRVCVSDAKSAVRWLRANADRLGIDPNRVGAGGGSAGGHLAAFTALLTGYDDPLDDTSVSPKPNALVLFNPALALAPLEDMRRPCSDQNPTLSWRMDADLNSISPGRHVIPGSPPTVIFHGSADAIVPHATAERFCSDMRNAGNRCELSGANHGFFNYRVNREVFEDTMRKAEAFLTSLGCVEA